jgi:hypothetical protein
MHEEMVLINVNNLLETALSVKLYFLLLCIALKFVNVGRFKLCRLIYIDFHPWLHIVCFHLVVIPRNEPEFLNRVTTNSFAFIDFIEYANFRSV